MIARELPREEWGRLKGPGVPELSHYAKPEDIRAVVVETDGEIVAQCLVVRLTHLEGLWIDSDHKNGGIGGALLGLTAKVAGEWASEAVMAGAADGDDRMLTLLARLGANRIGLQFFALRIGDQ